MSWSDIIALVAICLTCAGCGLGSAWWIIRMFWKIDVRLGRIEERLMITPAPEGKSNVIAMGNAKGRDFGPL